MSTSLLSFVYRLVDMVPPFLNFVVQAVDPQNGCHMVSVNALLTAIAPNEALWAESHPEPGALFAGQQETPTLQL